MMEQDIDPIAVPVAQPTPYARAVPLARAARLYLSPHLQTRGEAAVDAAIMLAATIASMVVGGIGAAILGTRDVGIAFVRQVALQAIVSLLAVRFLLQWRDQKADAIGLGRAMFWPSLGWGALAWVAAQVLNVLLVVVLWALLGPRFFETSIDDKVQMFDFLADMPVWWTPGAMVFIGFYEEIVFRGVMLSRLRVLFGKRSIVWPIVISSVIFGALHSYQGPLGIIQTTMLGILFGIVAAWRRDIWSCIVAHGMLDLISFILAFFLAPLARQMSASMPASQP